MSEIDKVEKEGLRRLLVLAYRRNNWYRAILIARRRMIIDALRTCKIMIWTLPFVAFVAFAFGIVLGCGIAA